MKALVNCNNYVHMKNYHKLAAAGALALTLAPIGFTVASDDTTAAHQNPMNGLAAAIAQKFNLNQADVQKVFDDQRAQMQTQMKTRGAEMEKTMLAKAVTDGKLTQAQAELITAKKAELEANAASFKASLSGKTKAEVQAAMKTQMDSIKSWATTNNIPVQYLRFLGGYGHGDRGMMGRGHGFDGKMKDGVTQSSAQ